MINHTVNNSVKSKDLNVPRERRSDNRLRAKKPAAATPAECDRVEKFLHGLKLVLSHHGAPSKVIKSLYKQAWDYLKVPREELFLKRAKYLLLVPMSRYLRNELPAPPDEIFVPKGAWKKWSDTRIKSFRNKNTHLWYSFLQAKRAAAPVSKEIVLANFQKHREQMLSPDPIGLEEEDEELLDRTMETIQPVLRRLSKKLKKSLAATFRHPEEHLFSASQSASLESTRKSGGQKGFLSQFEGRGLLPPRGELNTMTLHEGFSIRDRKKVANAITQERVVFPSRNLLLERIDAYARDPDQPRLRAKVEAVLEPFKVRTISKGPSVEYDGAKPVQKAIHSLMRKMSPFRLIGKPFDPTDLMDIRSAQERLGSLADHYWLSVDYSAATDGLSASLSEAILDGLLGALALENIGYYRLLKAVLAPHVISYPEVAGVQLPDVVQQNGQLMGSILSFPVLCLANLALYLLVRSYTRPDAKLSDLLNAVLVNGDDMIYIGTKEEWELHAKLGQRLGLAMSPGKAYYHRRYANINSVSVDYPLDRESTPLILPFLNVGLMVGNHKVMGKVGSDDEVLTSPTSSVIDEVVRGSWIGKQPEVLKQYIAMHRADLRRETKGRNLFIPISAGGMGQHSPPGFEVHVTKKQREFAGAILRDQPWLVPDIRPHPAGRVLEEIEDKIIDPMREVHSEAVRVRLRKGPQTSERLFHGFVPFQAFTTSE